MSWFVEFADVVNAFIYSAPVWVYWTLGGIAAWKSLRWMLHIN